MDFDVWLPTANPVRHAGVPGRGGTRGRGARGVHAIWVGEHVVTFEHYASSYPYAEDGQAPIPPGLGLLEPFTTLAFLAALTTTTRLGTAMCLLPQRNPVYTAKEVATVDWLSGGRVDLGVGVGWLREEFEAVAVPWERRGDRTDEYLQVLHTLWCEDPSSFTRRPTTPSPRATSIPSRSRTRIPPSTSAARATPPCAGWPGRARGGTPSTAAPADLPDAARPPSTALLAEQGRSRPEIDGDGVPVLQAPRRGHHRAVRRGRRRRRLGLAVRHVRRGRPRRLRGARPLPGGPRRLRPC